MTALRTVLAVLLAVLVATAGCSRDESKLQPYKETRQIMGIPVTITFYPPEGLPASDLAARAFAAVERVDLLMSDYRTDSELSKVNAAAGAEPVPVSKELHDVVLRGAYFSRLSGGAFDPTVRPLVKLWQASGIDNKLPTDEAIAQARALVDWQQISVLNWTDIEPAQTLRLAKPGMELDLGGIAKGYAVDLAIGALKDAGVKSALVAAAGDMFALGTHPDGRVWTIAIQSPESESEMLPDTLDLKDMAVSTSGDYRRFTEIEGKRYSHIIDPRTGRPVEHMSSVTVIAPTATDADALATAISVLGAEKGLELAKLLPGVEVMMMVARDGGTPKTVQSDGFARYVTPEKK